MTRLHSAREVPVPFVLPEPKIQQLKARPGQPASEIILTGWLTFTLSPLAQELGLITKRSWLPRRGTLLVVRNTSEYNLGDPYRRVFRLRVGDRMFLLVEVPQGSRNNLHLEAIEVF